MLVPSSDSRKTREPDLPLDTPEQVRHSHEVDSAREHRATARRMEGEAEAVEIANDDARFVLTRKKVHMTMGLIVFVLLLTCAGYLWVRGNSAAALGLLGGAGGIGGLTGLPHLLMLGGKRK